MRRIGFVLAASVLCTSLVACDGTPATGLNENAAPSVSGVKRLNSTGTYGSGHREPSDSTWVGDATATGTGTYGSGY